MLLALYKYNAYFVCVPAGMADAPTIPRFGETIRRLIPTGKTFSSRVLNELFKVPITTEEECVALQDGSLLIIATAREYTSQTLAFWCQNPRVDKLKYEEDMNSSIVGERVSTGKLLRHFFSSAPNSR